MASREEIQAALRDISRIADEHGHALDKAFRILADGALVGPEGVDLERTMLAWHGQLRTTLTTSFEHVRALAAGLPEGPPRVPEPQFGRPPAGYAPARSGVAGGDTTLLDLLHEEFGRSGRSWLAAADALTRVLARVGGFPGDARPIRQIAQEVLQRRSDLRRRRDLLERSDEVRGLGTSAGLVFTSVQLAELVARNPRLASRLRAAGADPAKIPLGADARSVAAWWKGLNGRQRRAYTEVLPSVIGWLDGLPATVRNAANRLTLANRLKELEAIPAGQLTPFEKRDLARLRNLQTNLANLEARGLNVYLLGFDSTTPGLADTYEPKPNPFGPIPGGDTVHGKVADLTPGPDGRVIIAIGNPDKADHTGIFVPGTTAQLDDLDGDILKLDHLYGAARDQVKDRPVSMILWLGYDAPDHVISDSPNPEYADVGGPQLDRFVDGVRSAQGDVHRHLTAIGHSYGSTVLGEGARTGNGLNVDDIVVAGSPGVRVDRAGKLHMSPSKVWSLAAPDDPVPAIGRLGHGDGIRFLPVPTPVVPSDPEFGGQRLITDTSGHSHYWDEGSQSLINQAKVVAGLHLNTNASDDPATKR